MNAINSKVFQNERVGIAMKKFRCYRVNVEEIGNRELREEYLRTAPSFLFFDPAGDAVAELKGKRASSLSTFSACVEKTWNQSFTVRMKPYIKQITEILTRLDKLNGSVQIQEQAEARQDSKPNALKQRKLEAQAEELRAEREAILADEREVLASVELRSRYRPAEQASLDR